MASARGIAIAKTAARGYNTPMATVGLIIKVSTVTLFLVEFASVLNRSRAFHRKREPGLFLVILGSLGLKTMFPDLEYFREFSVFVLLFTAEHYLSAMLPYKRERIYDFAFGGIVLISLVVIPTGAFQTLTYRLFHAFASAFLAAPVFALMYRLFRKLGKRNVLVTLIASAAALAVSGCEQFITLLPGVPFHLGDVCLLFLAASLGFLIFEEGYFIASSLQGLSARLSEEERRTNEVARRLLSTEESLIAQDRLVSLGTLAGGLTHEFKNILSLISGCAQYGLLNENPDKKNQSLALIREHIDHSQESVIRVLEQIRSHQKVDPREIDIGRFLGRFCKIVRANYRTSGIDIALDLRSNFRAVMKGDDLEQILLNLIRNAVAALLDRKELVARRINLTAHYEGGRGAIEVRDNAGGVSEAQALHLFELHDESSSSTGLGLYLTRLLAEQNGLALRYSLLDGESCFSVLFPERVIVETQPASGAAGAAR
ncbi:MAG: HAMP domain-containing histidine kinase [Spirochaetales bacterium]|nr:HAMP domain-containing histidine kinase [Spirochaetales bacterium]